MDIIVAREKIKGGLDVLEGQIENLYNLLYDHKRRMVPSCYDAMLETISGTVRDLRHKILTAPRVQK
jgi:hypothetical protein